MENKPAAKNLLDSVEWPDIKIVGAERKNYFGCFITVAFEVVLMYKAVLKFPHHFLKKTLNSPNPWNIIDKSFLL